MNTSLNLDEHFGEGSNIVYVRTVAAADLPKDIREKTGDVKELFAVHSATGERLALVAERRMAFVLARENDMEPVNVH